jgi:hypothetical protein
LKIHCAKLLGVGEGLNVGSETMLISLNN